MNVLECPWCGTNGNIELQHTPEGFMYVQVRCANKRCFATCPNGLFSTENMSQSEAEKKAIEKWNKRAPKRRI